MRYIYVFYPTKVIGGAELLFVRCLNFLAANYAQDFRVGYINYEDSYINDLLDKRVERISLESEVNLPEHSTILAPPFCIYKFPKFKTKDIYFLFWMLHIDEISSASAGCSKTTYNAVR